LLKHRRIAGGRAGLGIARMQMQYGRARMGRVDRLPGDVGGVYGSASDNVGV